MSDIEERLNSAYLAVRRSLRYAVSRIVPPKEVEDIVQETYVQHSPAVNATAKTDKGGR
jgi:DNA-directed RNA polymerase specialized sigma24 family protein